MSEAYDAALEVCGVLTNIDQNLHRMFELMPTQRERIATAVMAGLAASPNAPKGILRPEAALHFSVSAVMMAEALIAELNKPQEEKSGDSLDKAKS